MLSDVQRTVFPPLRNLKPGDCETEPVLSKVSTECKALLIEDCEPEVIHFRVSTINAARHHKLLTRKCYYPLLNYLSLRPTNHSWALRFLKTDFSAYRYFP